MNKWIDDPAAFHLGSRVRHPIFGFGQILDKDGEQCRVLFENGRDTWMFSPELIVEVPDENTT